jgi:hypothetical protein
VFSVKKQWLADAEQPQAEVEELEIDASDNKHRLKLATLDNAANENVIHIKKLELEEKQREA